MYAGNSLIKIIYCHSKTNGDCTLTLYNIGLGMGTFIPKGNDEREVLGFGSVSVAILLSYLSI